MSHRTHDNSIEAYKGILDTLTKSRARVMECIIRRGSATRQQIAADMGVPINQVTGRVRELLDVRAIFEGGSTIAQGRARALLVACSPESRVEEPQGRQAPGTEEAITRAITFLGEHGYSVTKNETDHSDAWEGLIPGEE